MKRRGAEELFNAWAPSMQAKSKEFVEKGAEV